MRRPGRTKPSIPGARIRTRPRRTPGSRSTSTAPFTTSQRTHTKHEGAMATITVTIPDDKLARVIDGVAAAGGYQENIRQPDGSTIPNPETKGQFVKRMVVRWVKSMVLRSELEAAIEVDR